MHAHTTRRTRTALLVAAVAVLGVGCSSMDLTEEIGDAAPEPVADELAEGATDGEDVATTGDGSAVTAGGADDVVTFGGSGSTVGRDLARTASLVLEVSDLERSAAQVSAAASRAGGFIAEANVRGGEFGYGVLTLRVPAATLDATVRDLAEVGVAVIESSITTEDLTEQLTDLGARIRNLERLEAELQELLADVRDTTTDSTQIMNVFGQLNDVRGQIERLEATRAGARDRVSLATINVELVPTAVAPEVPEVEPESTLARAWATTTDAFRSIGNALTWLGVTILPIALVVVGLPALLLWMLVRTVTRRHGDGGTAAATPYVASPPPPPAPQPVMAGGPAPDPTSSAVEARVDGPADDDA